MPSKKPSSKPTRSEVRKRNQAYRKSVKGRGLKRVEVLVPADMPLVEATIKSLAAKARDAATAEAEQSNS